ncbi:TetR/AcrR family transcriptional regulator [Snodgrassella gandavensis]|uniref:TetR/AcrR family transcriptional regulator n=1 Tax=Snodgrassella gandavensis TaxID=2946698 RepID=UPI001EF41F03|nr:TetR/AcrR family transcriptional regulator [Snodgrassella gandavensis]
MKSEIIDKILAAAESLFNEFGYCAVSLELVAERAGVSKRTLYKYFGDKNGLVSKVLLRRNAFFKKSITDVIAVFSEKKDKINALISWHIRWFNDNDYRGCMFVRAQAEYGNRSEEICSIVREHKLWMQTSIAQWLGATAASEQAACLIMLILEGMIAYTSVFGVEGHDFEREKIYIYDIVDAIGNANA